ncbi:MAG: triacylglycerol lipase [Lachnospiraceae bacterium]|jgi:triacylglycerol lipase|nr:triacylglycerol lipase [Lachnospiraceae bacterium]
MKYFIRMINTIVVLLLADVLTLVKIFNVDRYKVPVILLLVAWFILININPLYACKKPETKRLRGCAKGHELLIIFIVSTTVGVIYSIAGLLGAFNTVTISYKLWIANILMLVLIENTVFWNGIIRVYLTSEQLGFRIRIWGLICGMIPIAHLIVLGIIIKTVGREVEVENNKIIENAKRHDDRICATKYPILLVHGVFFRDFRYLNYWGRIPKELEENGATIFYGQQQSASSVAECGQEVADKILEICKEYDCEKVNIIAHSKGGLDSRYALNIPGIKEHVASLTTINTPHRGCEFADYLLSKISEGKKEVIANTYNGALKRLGDHDPDFIKAVTDLTATACKKRNEELPNVEGVYYQSIGSKLNKAGSGRFPLNFSYHLVNAFDGANDGLVGENSFKWGEEYNFLTVKGKRGISHGDMIDLNRENFDGFDVREFYVQLVAKLKSMGF